MPLFGCPTDQAYMESLNKEMYQLYMHKMDVWKLHFRTPSVNYVYHEDINRNIPENPTYSVEGYIDVNDNGVATLYKQGQQLDRSLYVYMGRKNIEDVLSALGLDKYRDIPTDGDVIRIQNGLWEVITVDPEGYHMNNHTAPFDYQFFIVPWQKTSIPKEGGNIEFRRY
jgi:hypothetical protein